MYENRKQIGQSSYEDGSLYFPSMMWRADCFPVSERTENKPNYSYGEMDLNYRIKETWGRAQRGMGSMDYSNMGSRSSKRWDRRKVMVIKEWGNGEDLGDKQLSDWGE